MSSLSNFHILIKLRDAMKLFLVPYLYLFFWFLYYDLLINNLHFYSNKEYRLFRDEIGLCLRKNYKGALSVAVERLV